MGHIDELWRLIGGRGGRIPGGRRNMLVEEVGIGCTYSDVTTTNSTDGGVGGSRTVLQSRKAAGAGVY